MFDYLESKPQEEVIEYLNASEYAELLERNIKTIDIVRKNIKTGKLIDGDFVKDKIVERKPLYTEEELIDINRTTQRKK